MDETFSERPIEDMLDLTKQLFASSTDVQTLRQATKVLKDMRSKESEVLSMGAKALVHSIATDEDEELEMLAAELAVAKDTCRQLEMDIEAMNREPDATSRTAQVKSDILRMMDQEQQKDEEFRSLGGEEKLRKQQNFGKSSQLAKLKRIADLYEHVTRIKWDTDVDEETTAGTITDTFGNVIKEFRFGQITRQDGELDLFTISNMVWQKLA